MTLPAKRTTSADVARLAGVSRTTVSFVLNDRPGQSIPDETRRRIFEAAKTLNYRPHSSARRLAAGRSDIVLLSIPELPIGSGISRFIEEYAAALAGHGLTLVTHLESAHSRPLADVAAAVDASVVDRLTLFDKATLEELSRSGVTAVTLPQPENVNFMEPDGRAQARHLIERGHRHLGYALPAHPDLLAMGEERLNGVARACADAGLPAPVALTVSLDAKNAAGAVTGWRERSVTAVCAFNDETAIAILAGLREHGLTAPADLAVIGVDDIPAARLAAPPLTTLAFDLHDAGRYRADMVAALLAGHKVEIRSGKAEPRLITRSST
jgi:DNA-binding LacI/PurR family transcriptional regulator